MGMKVPLIFNIQKFCVHDGPGIRTTVFFKGCPLKCRWCHNPEGMNFRIESIKTKDGKNEIVGKYFTVSELIKEIEKDQIFYEQSEGGATLSGGEVMMQDMNYIEELVQSLKRKGISVIIDTSGFAPFENFQRILPYVDRFLYDLKFFDSEIHREYTGVPNEMILGNLKKLSDAGGTISLRLIQVDGINNRRTDVEKIISWLHENKIHIDEINLLPYHEFGSDKYARLGQKCEIFTRPSDQTLESTRMQWEENHYEVKIGG
jgi:pyruvate formate lyase activating enzyme